jgi:uncharacterized protein YcbK (DUF882 family)
MGSDGRAHGSMPAGVTRRRFLGLVGTAVFTAMIPCPLPAATFPLATEKRRLSLINLHTKESLYTVYWEDGAYVLDALKDIDHILRDHRTGETRPTDPDLLDLLHLIDKKIHRPCTFQIVSGYRSPKTNAMLRKRSAGVAAKSYHTIGKAADIRVPGCSLSFLCRTAAGFRRGGVGYYPHPGFVHVDVGPVRYW